MPDCLGSGRTSHTIKGGEVSKRLTLFTFPQQNLPNLKSSSRGEAVESPTGFLQPSCTLLCLPLCVRLSPFCSVCAPLEVAWCTTRVTVLKVGKLWVRIPRPLLTSSMTLDLFLYLSLSLGVLICKMGLTYPSHRLWKGNQLILVKCLAPGKHQ